MPLGRTFRLILLVELVLVGFANAQDEVATSAGLMIALPVVAMTAGSATAADLIPTKPPHQFVKWNDGLIFEADDGSVRAHLGALIQQDWTAFGQGNSLISDPTIGDLQDGVFFR